MRTASVSSPLVATEVELDEIVSPEPVKTFGTKNTPSSSAVACLGGIRNKMDSNSSQKSKNSTAPSHEQIDPMRTDGFPPAPVPSTNFQNQLTASTPTIPASTTGDVERVLIPTGFESGFPKRPAGTPQTQDSTGNGRPPLGSPDTASIAADPQSIAGQCADALAFDGSAQSDLALLPARADGTFRQADNSVTPAARELSMIDSASTPPGPARDGTVIDESTPSRLIEKSWKQPGGPIPPGDLHAPIGGEPHEVHAIGAHTAAKERSQAEQGKQNYFAVQQSPLGGAHDSPAVRAEISIAKGEAPAIDSSKPSASSTALANPLDAMDTHTERSHPTWLHAGAHQAEAGFQDPTLGWIGVRAHVDSSGVHATLVPSSIEAAHSLGVDLANLNAYLAEHHAQLEKVTLAKPDAEWTDHGMQHGMNERQGQGEEHGSRRGANREEKADVHSGSSARIPVPDFSQPHGRIERSLPLGRPRSTHISLMA
jgi:hypothetical protein